MDIQPGMLIRRSGTSLGIWRVASVAPTGQVFLVNIETGRNYQAAGYELAKFVKA